MSRTFFISLPLFKCGVLTLLGIKKCTPEMLKVNCGIYFHLNPIWHRRVASRGGGRFPPPPKIFRPCNMPLARALNQRKLSNFRGIFHIVKLIKFFSASAHQKIGKFSLRKSKLKAKWGQSIPPPFRPILNRVMLMRDLVFDITTFL